MEWKIFWVATADSPQENVAVMNKIIYVDNKTIINNKILWKNFNFIFASIFLSSIVRPTCVSVIDYEIA